MVDFAAVYLSKGIGGVEANTLSVNQASSVPAADR